MWFLCVTSTQCNSMQQKPCLVFSFLALFDALYYLTPPGYHPIPIPPIPSRPLLAPQCYILLRRVIFYTQFFGDLNRISTGYYAGVWALMCLFCLRKCFFNFRVRSRIRVKSFCLNWIAVQMLFWVVIEKQSWGKLKPDRINSEMEKDQFYGIFYNNFIVWFIFSEKSIVYFCWLLCGQLWDWLSGQVTLRK